MPPTGLLIVIVSWLNPVSTSNCSPAKSVVNSGENCTPATVTGALATTTIGVSINHGPTAPAGRGGNAILPACPISCSSSSVAPRTLVCISVRFAIVPCVIIIWFMPFMTMAEIAKSTKSDTMVSSNVNPACCLRFMILHSLLDCGMRPSERA